MSLDERISESHKDIVGSRTENRLSIQLSYAMQLVMEYYSMDYIVLMDYIEDVVVITSDADNENEKIHMYQIKSKTADKNYSISTVLKKQWFEKLYDNATKYNEYLGSASLVCNTEIVDEKSKPIFANNISSLLEFESNPNIDKIKDAIAKDQKTTKDSVDLSDFYFVHTTLSTKGHRSEAEHKFSDFLFDKDEDIQVATVKTIFDEIYKRLENKFRNEISNDCTDIDEIYGEKGIKSSEIKSIIDTGVLVQLPEAYKLYDLFNIKKPNVIRKYNSKYSQIKIDLHSDFSSLNYLKEVIHNVVINNTDDIEDFENYMLAVYNKLNEENSIPMQYSDEYYLKLLIMIIIYKDFYGGKLWI